MPYILENITLYENSKFKKTNFVVKGDTIYSRDTPVRKMNFIRLQLDKHIIIATETVIGDLKEWLADGLEYVERIVLLGSTTVVFPVDVKYEYQVKQELSKAREQLNNFPLDYVLVLRLSARLIKPSIVRFCKQQCIPAIILNVENELELQKIAWCWIKDAVFPYNLTFIPSFTRRREYLSCWRQCMDEANLSHSREPLTTHQPLTKDILKKIGLYPYKGILRIGGEISYNILKENSKKCLITNDTTYYDKIEFTIFKNEVIRFNGQVDFSTAVGTEMKIKVPGFFQ